MTKKTPKAASTPTGDGVPPSDLTRDYADALYRTGIECCRQRERTSRLGEIGANQVERKAAERLARHCDEMLIDAVLAYEKAAAKGRPAGQQEWWHRANILWLASREYERRHRGATHSSRRLDDQTSATLGALAMDYDLEASALLALQQVLEDYRKCRPEADIVSTGKVSGNAKRGT